MRCLAGEDLGIWSAVNCADGISFTACAPTLRFLKFRPRLGTFSPLRGAVRLAPCPIGGSTLGAIVALAERDPDLFSEFSAEDEEDGLRKNWGNAVQRRTRRVNGEIAHKRVETVRQRQARAHKTGGIVWDSIKSVCCAQFPAFLFFSSLPLRDDP